MSSEYVYEFQAYFRRTRYGGRDETHVYKIENNELIEIQPTITKRSKTGRHGYDTWRLPIGTYIVVYISRSNNVNKPYEVLIKKLHVTDKPEWTVLLKTEIMNLSELNYLIEKAKELVIHG